MTDPLLLLLLGALPWGCQGAGIFVLGNKIDQKPWDIMGMYFSVFGITIVIELIVHKVHQNITSESGQNIVHHVTQEVMILGGLSAVLVVFENLGGASLIDTALFHYVHFVIFVMMIVFIILVSALFITVDRSWESWSRFEHKVGEIEADPSLTLEGKSAFLQQYIRSVSNGQKMLSGIVFFRQNLPGPFKDVSFSRYMKKMQRKFLLSYLDLHAGSWFLLALLCALAAGVTKITLQVSENELATIGLWVLFVGFGPLLVLVVTFFKIRKEFSRFTSDVQEMRMDGVLKPTHPQSRHFWRKSPEFMVKLIQTMLLYQVFFVATAAVNFTYRLLQVKPMGYLLLLVCFIPTGFVFFLMVPLLLPPFTILASLGDFLDHDTLLRMKVADKQSGKYRRQQFREDAMLRPAKFIYEDVDDLGLDLHLGDQHHHEKFSPAEPLLKGEIEMREKERLTTMCWECGKEKAFVMCEECGISLCPQCDIQYHRLKRLVNHTRTGIGENRGRLKQVKQDGELGDDDFAVTYPGGFSPLTPAYTDFGAVHFATSLQSPLDDDRASFIELNGDAVRPRSRRYDARSSLRSPKSPSEPDWGARPDSRWVREPLMRADELTPVSLHPVSSPPPPWGRGRGEGYKSLPSDLYV
eukprot:Sspe_Gene.25389::Locus_10186_Transcript_1_1_Confidence_1.000_Length_2151::g.25389::m.25389